MRWRATGRRSRPASSGLARTLGLASPGFEGVLGWILDLRRKLEIPESSPPLGVAEEHIGTLAPRAAADPSAASNPLPFGEAEYAELYRDALAGRLAG